MGQSVVARVVSGQRASERKEGGECRVNEVRNKSRLSRLPNQPPGALVGHDIVSSSPNSVSSISNLALVRPFTPAHAHATMSFTVSF